MQETVFFFIFLFKRKKTLNVYFEKKKSDREMSLKFQDRIHEASVVLLGFFMPTRVNFERNKQMRERKGQQLLRKYYPRNK